MKKILIKPSDYLYPQPVVLVGANVNGIPNFTTVSWVGIANEHPPMISIALKHARHTLKGIRQSNTFSVNIPSVELVEETDYCGLVSGATVNKAEKCRFKVFYGGLAEAPFIEQCPVNLGCEVVQNLDLGSHSFIIGTIVQSYVSESCMTDGKLDTGRINPIVYITGITGQYHSLGDFLGNAYSAGKVIKK